MKLSRKIETALQQARRKPGQVAERVKVRFAVSLEQRRRAAELSYSQLALRMETSPAYISKVFRGDSNLTIETMAKLAVATGSELDIRLVEPDEAHGRWTLSTVAFNQPSNRNWAAGSSTTITRSVAANHGMYELVG